MKMEVLNSILKFYVRWYPKDGDLNFDRTKPIEKSVEVRRVVDVKITFLFEV